jgi:D-psicose/D-tagatose/L-ribulose 3-epimerase
MRRTIGVNTWVWVSPVTDASLPELAAKAARLGFGAIELPVEQPGDWSADAAAETLAEHGLAPIIKVAETLGAGVVAGPFTASTGRTWRMDAEERDDLYRELRTSLAPIVRQAEERGIRLAIEPLNRYETSLVNTVEQALEALGPLLGPGLGLALDSYHLNIEEKHIGDAIRAAGPHIAHVQVCGNDRGAVGDDHLDWPGFLDALDDVGYAGPLGLESFTGENATIAVAASVWRPLAPSQDALAERSIRYLTALQDERDHA